MLFWSYAGLVIVVVGSTTHVVFAMGLGRFFFESLVILIGQTILFLLNVALATVVVVVNIILVVYAMELVLL